MNLKFLWTKWKKINQWACYNRIWSWSPMSCEKHGPRASVTTKTSAFGLGFCLLSPSGHVFHTTWETMIKSYNIYIPFKGNKCNMNIYYTECYTPYNQDDCSINTGLDNCNQTLNTFWQIVTHVIMGVILHTPNVMGFPGDDICWWPHNWSKRRHAQQILQLVASLILRDHFHETASKRSGRLC